MKGHHHIVVESPRLKYEFDIKRNITIILGDSATGKTTLIDLIRDFGNGGTDSPVQIASDVPCEVFSAPEKRWKESLELIHDSIVFIDEENHFIRSAAFAGMVLGSSNYFVLITRESLPELPYSIEEIYGIRNSGKYHFPQKIYHEFYPIYGELSDTTEDPYGKTRLLTEDTQSGFQFFQGICGKAGDCVSAGGNGNIFRTITKQPEDLALAVIADGAAFGAYISKVLEYAKLRRNILLYFPESFEWLILKSGVTAIKADAEALVRPEDYISSEKYASWEQFFTALLIQITKDDPIRKYQKSKLRPFYVQGIAKERILQTLPEELQAFLRTLA